MGYFDEAVAQCAQLNALPPRTEAQSRRENPRWNAANGQTGRVVLRNATLFDGEAWLEGPVDITLDKGLVVSVSASTASATSSSDGEQVVHDLQGRFVTPGLVDMHSHHLGNLWPSVGAITSDANEMNAATEALTPQARVLDALKPYDVATALIASGGVTSSLLLPGSANLIGGEGVPVKNAVRPGSAGEPVIEEMLLEHGVPEAERRRYIKMAMGENPKRVWKHTRMGSAMILRAHFEKAKALKERQDDYCEAVDGLVSSSSSSSSRAAFIHAHGRFPYDAALESSVALLRGQVMAQNHNYETEDMETMLRISREFGFRVWGFHHAVEAWQVPDLLRDQGDNVTVATFAEFSLYKVESYEPSLHAGKILDEHGVAVAYKSDHSTGLTHAKYLASQAAVAHAFHLPEAKALQAVTSIPARAIDQDFRIGYCRSGYDADVVVWDAHPLSLGATPLQVFIDGARQLDDDKVQESMGTTFDAAPEEDASTAVVERDSYTVQTRYEPDDHVREVMCAQAEQPGQSFIIRGISKAFVHHYPELQAMAAASDIDTNAGRLELVIDAGRAVCLGSEDICAEHTQRVLAATTSMPAVELTLRDGHLLPGLTALTNGLGMREIATEASTGDGQAKSQKLDDPNTLQHAQHGVWLDGKTFARARLGGVTRAVSPPVADSPEFVTGVSAAILTSGRKGLTDGGIIKGDVALHLYLGDPTRASQDSVSNGIRDLRRVLGQSRASHFGTPLRKVVVGEMPVVVRCNNKVGDGLLFFGCYVFSISLFFCFCHKFPTWCTC
jgi:imidazolonepropionase-like amidohydrolase